MRGESRGRGRSQRRRGVAPGVIEQLADGPLAGGERRDQAAFTLPPVLDVLVELGGGVLDDRAVTGSQSGDGTATRW